MVFSGFGAALQKGKHRGHKLPETMAASCCSDSLHAGELTPGFVRTFSRPTHRSPTKQRTTQIAPFKMHLQISTIDLAANFHLL